MGRRGTSEGHKTHRNGYWREANWSGWSRPGAEWPTGHNPYLLPGRDWLQCWLLHAPTFPLSKISGNKSSLLEVSGVSHLSFEVLKGMRNNLARAPSLALLKLPTLFRMAKMKTTLTWRCHHFFEKWQKWKPLLLLRVVRIDILINWGVSKALERIRFVSSN